MTYREAIGIVARLPDVGRVSAQQHPDRVLAKVARWPDDAPAVWAELVESVGVPDWTERVDATPVTMPPKRNTVRRQKLIELWREKPWTIPELAMATGISEPSLRHYKRTIFRGYHWTVETRGKFEKAYQLGAGQ